MFVAIDEENKQVFGPFDSEVQGEAWCREYIRKVESHSWDIPGVDLNTDFDLDFYMWNVQEVQFVDIEDTEFVEFIGTQAQRDAYANPDCECCQNNKDDPEHYHSPVCSPDFQEIEIIPDETGVYARSSETNPNALGKLED